MCNMLPIHFVKKNRHSMLFHEIFSLRISLLVAELFCVEPAAMRRRSYWMC